MDKVLIVKSRALGDSIMGLSSIQYIRNLFPDTEIVYAVNSWIIPLYSRVITAADRVVSCDLKTIGSWLSFLDFLLDEKFDLIYELHQSGRTSKLLNLYSKISSTPYLFHNHHLKSGESDVHDQGVIKPLIQRELDGIWTFLGHNSVMPSYLNYPPIIGINRVDTSIIKRQIIFGIVATRESKMWPLNYFISLGKLISERFPDIKIVIPISSSAYDLALATTIKESGQFKCDIVNLPLDDLPHLFVDSLLYVGNDTGIKHLAISVGVKTITVFGPEPPNEWHPYNLKEHIACFIENMSCRTEKLHYCGLSHCSHLSCMKEITVDEVFNHITNILNKLGILRAT